MYKYFIYELVKKMFKFSVMFSPYLENRLMKTTEIHLAPGILQGV